MNVDWGGRPGDDGYADPAFPALQDVLAPLVPGRQPVAVYYYPGRTLQVTHADGAGGLLTRDAVPLGGDPRGATVLGPGERWDGALRCVVRTFPHDPGLPELPGIVAGLGAAADDVLSYLPGLRAVLRATTPTGPVVVKAGDRESLRRNHSRHTALHALEGRGFGVSRPLDVDPGRGLRREELLAGTCPVRALAAGARPGPLAAAVAAPVAALHALDPADDLLLADHTAPVLLARWRRKTLRTVGRALPALAPRAAAVVDVLDGARPAGLGDAAGVVHGDLHTANVLVGPAGVTLLDLDALGRGDPELDLAVLVGRLLLVAVAAGPAGGAGPVALARGLVPAYDAAARTAGRRALRADVLAWYLAGTLVGRQVRTSIRHLAPGLEPLCDRLVRLAEQVLRHVPAGPGGPGVGAAAVVDDLAGTIVAGPGPAVPVLARAGR